MQSRNVWSRIDRRGFLKTVGLGTPALGAILAACTAQQPMPAASSPAAPTSAPASVSTPTAGQAAKPTAAPAAASPKPATSEAITLWLSGAGPIGSFWENAAETFNQDQSQVTVKVEHALAGVQNLVEEMQKVRLSLQSRSAGDIIKSSAIGRQLEEYEKTSQLADLSDAYRDFGWEQRILRSTQEMMQVGGKFYALPEAIEIVGYWYNKDLWNKAGATPPTTIEQFMEAGEKLKAAQMPMKAVGVRAGWPAAYYGSAYIYAAAGSRYRQALEGKAGWVDPKMEQGLQTLKDLIDRGYANPEPLSLNGDQEVEIFFQEKVASIMRGNGFIGQVQATAPSWDVGFFALPLIDSASDVKIYGGIGGSWTVPAFTKNRDGAIAFLDYAFSEEVATEYAVQGLGFIPVPIELPDDANPVIKDMDRAVQSYAAEGLGHYPITFLAPGTFSKLHSFIQGLIGNQITAHQVLEEMEKAVKQAAQG